MDHLARNAKAYAALVGSIVTAVLGLVPADSQWHAVLIVVGIIATAIATQRVPNRTTVSLKNQGGQADLGVVLLVLTFVGVVLLLFRVHL